MDYIYSIQAYLRECIWVKKVRKQESRGMNTNILALKNHFEIQV